ncbi:MAG: hypothetical protein Q4C95_11420 [Planctomycetia bacterium]|nr:hypothetical protein [Planctomycetia bacterium]
MRIINKITSCTENTIIYEHNGKRGSLTCPGIISFEKMEERIKKELALKDNEPVYRTNDIRKDIEVFEESEVTEVEEEMGMC